MFGSLDVRGGAIISVMIYTLSGAIAGRKENFFVVDVSGVGFKVFSNKQTVYKLPKGNEPVHVYCHMHVKEDAMELYGFLDEGELGFFEMLISVSGVGPKTALAVLDLDSFPNVMAAIAGKKADVLSRAPGVGRKTAERIILDLQNRIDAADVKGLDGAAEINVEVEEALHGLGYEKQLVKEILSQLKNGAGDSLEERLKRALKILGSRKER